MFVNWCWNEQYMLAASLMTAAEPSGSPAHSIGMQKHARQWLFNMKPLNFGDREEASFGTG
jgi:hypothetical protein